MTDVKARLSRRLATASLLATMAAGCEDPSRQLGDLEGLKRVRTDLDAYYAEHSRFPDSLSELGSPTDAWGNAIAYESDGQQYELRALGRNGVHDACDEPRSTCGEADADTVVTEQEWRCLCSK